MSAILDKGAHFYRCDFQVHTPRDLAWKGAPCTSAEERKDYAKKLVEKCRAEKLNAIAISDHHDICFFPYIKEAADQETDLVGEILPQQEKLIVFPAIELTLNVPCQAILILDSDFPESFLTQVLTVLAIKPASDDVAKADEPVRLHAITTLEQLKDRLDEHDFLKGRYIVLPNVTSGGSFTLMRQGANQKYISMPCVGGYLDGPVTKCGVGDKAILNGENKHYGNKRIALFQTSDSRSEDHSALGRYSTWVKWATPTAEALRQACLAQDSRILQDPPQLPSVVIKSLHVSNSEFLGPITLHFNPQYTALIGSRGTGKSTILEYLRWGLCDEHEDSDVFDTGSVSARQQKLILNTLKKYEASVEVGFEINGVSHLVRRRSGTGEILLRIGSGELQPCTRDDIRTLFPLDAYSQKQLSRVGHRVEELHRFVRSGIKTELDSIDAGMRSLSSDLREIYATLRRKQIMEASLREDQLSIISLTQQAKSIRGSLTGLTPENQQLLSMQPKYLEADLLVTNWDEEFLEIKALVTELSDRLDTLSSKPTNNFDDHPAKDILLELQEARKAQLKEVAGITEKIEGVVGNIVGPNRDFSGAYGEKREAWHKNKAVFDQSYQTVKSTASSNESKLQALTELDQKIKMISERINGVNTQISSLGDPEATFREKLEQWVTVHRQRGDLYSGQCEKLNRLSDGVIRAKVLRGKNIAAVQEQIKAIMRGSGLRAAKIDEMLACVVAAEDSMAVWAGILAELEAIANLKIAGGNTDQKPTSEVLASCGFVEGDFSRLLEKLTPEAWLDLALTSLDDETTFEYRTKEQEYIPFENASAGQQATALLFTLLNQVGPPLVIDQPEDDLDNQIIFEIVNRIWRAKSNRQLIFSSHNANLVVNGDSELVVWCDYRVAGDFSRGQISGEGAIDIKEIRDAIKTIMEGGEKAFRLRSQKYGF